mmetsp:Transcript_51164/g.163794  ORF Transcript_51164/g.163794 Transcript_51164/m.163794 type:complete len:204 (-) Transcript_51164:289-900(-)
MRQGPLSHVPESQRRSAALVRILALQLLHECVDDALLLHRTVCPATERQDCTLTRQSVLVAQTARHNPAGMLAGHARAEPRQRFEGREARAAVLEVFRDAIHVLLRNGGAHAREGQARRCKHLCRLAREVRHHLAQQRVVAQRPHCPQRCAPHWQRRVIQQPLEAQSNGSPRPMRAKRAECLCGCCPHPRVAAAKQRADMLGV